MSVAWSAGGEPSGTTAVTIITITTAITIITITTAITIITITTTTTCANNKMVVTTLLNQTAACSKDSKFVREQRRRKQAKALKSVAALFVDTQHPTTVPSKRSKKRRKYRSRKKLRDQPNGDVSAVDNSTPHSNGSRRRRRSRRQNNSKEVAVLSPPIFTKGEWRRARLRSHPQVDLVIEPEHAPSQKVKVQGLADSGAQSDVWSLEAYLSSGFSKDDLRPVSLSLNAANKFPIHIDGAFFSTISGRTADGRVISHNAMIYVSRDVKGFYL